jgi:coenzyme Q-binding protein COQ10
LNPVFVDAMPIHESHCSLPYPREDVFDLAADVERYPEFVPWWVAARIYKREANIYYTDQVIRFAMMRKRFTSKTTLYRPERIDVDANGDIVRNLRLTWIFVATPGNGCNVMLKAELDLGSKLIEDLFARAMIHGTESVMSAFKTRARRLYGGACAS